MPVIDFDLSKVHKTTSRFLVYYLDKENKNVAQKDKTCFFDHEKEVSDLEEIIQKIDTNNARLCKDEDRYYSLYVSPSKKELEHINSDPEKLKAYTRNLMDCYAKNFGKGYTGHDLLYYGRIERNRYYTYNDPEVKSGFVKKGTIKTGNNSHIHIIVSRKTKTKWYKGERVVDHTNKILTDDPEYVKRAGTAKISPLDTARKGTHFKIGKIAVQRGFDRTRFKQRGEELFDSMFLYKRKDSEKFSYSNLKKNHPDKFIVTYGKQPLLENDLLPSVLKTESQKLRYVLQNIEELLPCNAEQPKEVFHQILKEKGITVSKTNFTFNGSSFSKNDISSRLLKATNLLFAAYYFGEKFSREAKQQEKTKEDKDKNN